MLNLGSKICLIFLLGVASANGRNFYYTCSYADSVAPSNILFSKIDLNAKTIACNCTLRFEGNITEETARAINNNMGGRFLGVFTNNGLTGKNTAMAERNSVNYGIIDNQCNLLSNGSIDNIFLYARDDYGSRWDSAFTYIQGRGDNEEEYRAQVILNSNRQPQFRDSRVFNFDAVNHVQIDRFKYYKRISPSSRYLYWDIIDTGIYLLKLNVDSGLLSDSLMIDNAVNRLYLFGFNESDSAIYVFYMNYTRMSPLYPELRKTTIDPSYVKIYSYDDFSLVDSVEINYPPLDSGYIQGISSSIDKVGPYFVYFDLVQENRAYFSPAMLFIFDTRTNEASWLRVGWR